MKVEQNKKQPVEATYSDEDLFVLMSFQKEDEVEAQKAFRIFYSRYSKLLKALCNNVCTKFDVVDGKEFAASVFNNTMLEIYHYPTYDSRKGKITTWVSKIARNEALEIIKGFGLNNDYRHVPLNEAITEFVVDEENKEDEERVNYDTPQKRVLDDALNSLSEREREILLTCILFQEDKKHLPDEVLCDLNNRFGTTSAGIRQIKKRALDKVKAYIIKNSTFLQTSTINS